MLRLLLRCAAVLAAHSASAAHSQEPAPAPPKCELAATPSQPATNCSIRLPNGGSTWSTYITAGDAFSFGDLSARINGFSGTDLRSSTAIMDLRLGGHVFKDVLVGRSPVGLPMCGREVTFTFIDSVDNPAQLKVSVF